MASRIWTDERRSATRTRLKQFKEFIGQIPLKKNKRLLENVLEDAEEMLNEISRRGDRFDSAAKTNEDLREELNRLKPIVLEADSIKHNRDRDHQTRVALRQENRELRARLKKLGGE